MEDKFYFIYGGIIFRNISEIEDYKIPQGEEVKFNEALTNYIYDFIAYAAAPNKKEYDSDYISDIMEYIPFIEEPHETEVTSYCLDKAYQYERLIYTHPRTKRLYAIETIDSPYDSVVLYPYEFYEVKKVTEIREVVHYLPIEKEDSYD